MSTTATAQVATGGTSPDRFAERVAAADWQRYTVGLVFHDAT